MTRFAGLMIEGTGDAGAFRFRTPSGRTTLHEKYFSEAHVPGKMTGLCSGRGPELCEA